MGTRSRMPQAPDGPVFLTMSSRAARTSIGLHSTHPGLNASPDNDAEPDPERLYRVVSIPMGGQADSLGGVHPIPGWAQSREGMHLLLVSEDVDIFSATVASGAAVRLQVLPAMWLRLSRAASDPYQLGRLLAEPNDFELAAPLFEEFAIDDYWVQMSLNTYRFAQSIGFSAGLGIPSQALMEAAGHISESKHKDITIWLLKRMVEELGQLFSVHPNQAIPEQLLPDAIRRLEETIRGVEPVTFENLIARREELQAQMLWGGLIAPWIGLIRTGKVSFKTAWEKVGRLDEQGQAHLAEMFETHGIDGLEPLEIVEVDEAPVAPTRLILKGSHRLEDLINRRLGVGLHDVAWRLDSEGVLVVELSQPSAIPPVPPRLAWEPRCVQGVDRYINKRLSLADLNPRRSRASPRDLKAILDTRPTLAAIDHRRNDWFLAAASGAQVLSDEWGALPWTNGKLTKHVCAEYALELKKLMLAHVKDTAEVLHNQAILLARRMIWRNIHPSLFDMVRSGRVLWNAALKASLLDEETRTQFIETGIGSVGPRNSRSLSKIITRHQTLAKLYEALAGHRPESFLVVCSEGTLQISDSKNLCTDNGLLREAP